MSTYKELLALVAAVKKWRPYLLGHFFIIRTNHQSLKFLLEHKIGTPMQQRWVSKLLGYEFVVEYKKGQENKVADALSRMNEDKLQTTSLAVISYPSLEWLLEVKDSYANDPTLLSLVKKVEEGLMANIKYCVRQGILLYKKRLYIPNTLQENVLQFVHSSSLAGHAGYDKTIHKARKDLFWPRMKANVKRFMREIDICQRVKPENLSPVGLLQ
jgi:hypothetical protein